VPGRDAAGRCVPLPPAAVESFREYLTDRGLDPGILSNDPDTPLIARMGSPAPLSSARIYEVLARGFAQCASDLARTDPASAARIVQASTRWLRHSHAAHAVACGLPQGLLQRRLGHRSAASTAIYAVARPGGDRLAAAEGFRESPVSAEPEASR
jgi:integrase